MAERLKIEGRGNLRDAYADEYTPEERKWLKEAHPDDYKVLQYLEREHDKKNPPAKPKAGKAVVTTTHGDVVKATPATPAQQQKEEAKPEAASADIP